MDIKITADRIIDLSKDELDKLGITTMSCFINMGGKSYEDMIDITPEVVFEHMRKTGEIAKTAAKSPDAYYEFFKPFTDDGKAIIHFAASSGISAICGYSMQAAERLPNVYVVDTKSLSSGVALLAKYAISLIESGETDAKAIADLCIKKIDKLQSSFIIETLECLHKGGRCSSLQYFGANLLKIKPVITLDKTTGKMITREKCRGQQRRALADYVKNTFAKYPNPDLTQLYVVHFSKDEETLQYFLDTIKQHHIFENISINQPGCNCGVHSGPGTFGMFYFMK